MPKRSPHIGVVACSFPGAALCVQTLCAEYERSMGPHKSPEISLHMLDFAEHVGHVRAGHWEALGGMLLRSAQKLSMLEVDFLICPDNTAHLGYASIADQLSASWLHIAVPVAIEAVRQGYRKVGLLGTSATVLGDVYPTLCSQYGLTIVRPEDAQREALDRLIFDHLCRGHVPEHGARLLNEMTSSLRDAGCDAIVLGCTELAMLPGDHTMPVLDSNRLLAIAAAERASSLAHAQVE